MNISFEKEAYHYGNNLDYLNRHRTNKDFYYHNGTKWVTYTRTGSLSSSAGGDVVTLDDIFAVPDDQLTAIQEVGADVNAPVEYYNLQGVKVANPENGIFIKKQGAKTSKVVL